MAYPPSLFASSRLCTGLVLLVSALVYYLAAKAGMALFSLQPSNITLLWLPSGIGAAMVLGAGPLALPWIFLASVLANYPGMVDAPHGNALLHIAIAALADGFAAWLAAWACQRQLHGSLRRVADLFRFGVWVCLLPTVVSSLLITCNLAWGGYIAWDTLPNMLRILVLADSLGLLLVLPLYLGWHATSPATATRSMRVWRLLSVNVFGLLCIHGSFEGYAGLIFFVLPTLIYLAAHDNLRAVGLSLLATSVYAIHRTAGDQGPFLARHEMESVLMLVSYLVSTAFVVLTVVLHHKQLLLTEQQRQEWQFRAEYDPLTGAATRPVVIKAIDSALERAQCYGQSFTVAMLDLDHFKRVNDTYGHAAGDEVLRTLSQVVRANIRAIDIFARMGGEEFVILFPQLGMAMASQTLERIRLALQAQPTFAQGQAIAMTVSIGAVEFSCGTSSSAQLLACADRRLYNAKAQGRNRTVTTDAP